MKAEDFTQRLAADARSLQELKTLARNDPRAALKGAAQQFEAFFMQMMLKSMRETLPQDGMFDSDQTRFFTGMLDQQMAQTMGSKGALGFAQMLERQLGAAMPDGMAASSAASIRLDQPARRSLPPDVATPLRAAPAARGDLPAPASGQGVGSTALPESANSIPRDFVSRVWPHAQEAAAATGIPAHFLVAQAALESGWGRAEPARADGSSSFNVFGVKAGRSWQGDSVAVATTEFVGGKAVATIDRFRAYGSYREAFMDYAALLTDKPRFNRVLGAIDGTDFANSLQQSGYATDPMYGAKLLRIIQGKTLRDALLG